MLTQHILYWLKWWQCKLNFICLSERIGLSWCMCVHLCVCVWLCQWHTTSSALFQCIMLTVIQIMSCMGICKLCICNISTQNHLSKFYSIFVRMSVPLSLCLCVSLYFIIDGCDIGSNIHHATFYRMHDVIKCLYSMHLVLASRWQFQNRKR